jgi:hypothetical protein
MTEWLLPAGCVLLGVFLRLAVLWVLPIEALAATAVSTPVSAVLAATIQRLALRKRVRALSRAWLEWWCLGSLIRSQ